MKGFVIVGWLALCMMVKPASGGESQNAFTVDREGAITERGTGALSAALNIGSLPAGTSGLVRLKLYNNSSQTIQIGKVVTPCGCIKVKHESNVIAPEDFVLIEAKLDVPVKARTIKYDATLLFNGTDHGKGFSVKIEFDISNLLAFGGDGCHAQIKKPGGVQKFTIPFLISEPLTLKDVLIEKSTELDSVLVEIADSSLICSVDPADLVQSCVGTISISSRGGRVSTAKVILELLDSISFAPSILVFNATPVDKIDQSQKSKAMDDRLPYYSAKAIVRVNVDDPNLQLKDAMPVSVSAESGNTTVYAKRMARGIYRINVLWQRKADEPQLDGGVNDVGNGPGDFPDSVSFVFRCTTEVNKTIPAHFAAFE